MDDIEYKIVTSKGKPVQEENKASYISGILAENLRICMDFAKRSLPGKNS